MNVPWFHSFVVSGVYQSFSTHAYTVNLKIFFIWDDDDGNYATTASSRYCPWLHDTQNDKSKILNTKKNGETIISQENNNALLCFF
jgi:hypothetical protein